MQKNQQNNQIIWLTGQPGSGKTTLANALKAKFESTTNKVLIVDGDDLRNITTNKDYSRACLLYTSPSPRDATLSRMPSSA